MENMGKSEINIDDVTNKINNFIKQLLTENFNNVSSKSFNYTDIKTYEDAIDFKEVDKENILYSTDSIDVIAYKKLKHIVSVINDANFKASYTDSSQKKWYPYFEIRNSSGCAVFGFRVSTYGYGVTYTYAGSFLVLDCQEKAVYMGKQFTSLYEAYLIDKD